MGRGYIIRSVEKELGAGFQQIAVRIGDYITTLSPDIGLRSTVSPLSMNHAWNIQSDPGLFKARLLDFACVSVYAIPNSPWGVLPSVDNILVPWTLRHTDARVGSVILSIWENGLQELGFKSFLAKSPEKDGLKWWPKKGYVDPRLPSDRRGRPDYYCKVLV